MKSYWLSSNLAGTAAGMLRKVTKSNCPSRFTVKVNSCYFCCKTRYQMYLNTTCSVSVKLIANLSTVNL